jgi:hypothetical protein
VIPHGYDMPHKNLHEAKRDTTCSLCRNPIKRGETIVIGRRGNVTCRDCIGQDAQRRDAERLNDPVRGGPLPEDKF